MLFHPDRAQRLAHIMDRLRADEPSADLLFSTAEACERIFSSRETERVKKLIDVGAWTDAALALLEIQLPTWKLRRSVYDEGEWHCAISQERELPEWLDSAIETHHANLSIAILKALVEGLGTDITADRHGAHTLRPARKVLESESLVYCDNFG